jgi:hypothetical protein
MVFYIIACHKEGKSEDDICQIVASQVLKDSNRVIGEVFPLTKSVSTYDYFNFNLGGQNPVQSWVS